MTRGHRSAAVAVVGALAFLAVGVWGVVNFTQGDWFIGALFAGCAVVGLSSVLSTVRRMRREQRATSARAGGTRADRR